MDERLPRDLYKEARRDGFIEACEWMIKMLNSRYQHAERMIADNPDIAQKWNTVLETTKILLEQIATKRTEKLKRQDAADNAGNR